jgi:hypothetical protein
MLSDALSLHPMPFTTPLASLLSMTRAWTRVMDSCRPAHDAGTDWDVGEKPDFCRARSQFAPKMAATTPRTSRAPRAARVHVLHTRAEFRGPPGPLSNTVKIARQIRRAAAAPPVQFRQIPSNFTTIAGPPPPYSMRARAPTGPPVKSVKSVKTQTPLGPLLSPPGPCAFLHGPRKWQV